MNQPKPQVILAGLLAVALIGCDAQNEPPERTTAPAQEEVSKQKTMAHPAGGYSLSVSSQPAGDNKVQVSLTTNIPGTIEVMAAISLANQKPDDTYLGMSQRVRLVKGTGEAVFDVGDLPSGQYNVEASFYPLWGFKDEDSESSGIKKALERSHPITLTGSGEPAEVATQRNKNQKWVMENVVVGSAWKPDSFKDRFGAWEEFPVTTVNEDIISNYYFRSLDMTLIVNTGKDEVVTWRMGRDGL